MFCLITKQQQTFRSVRIILLKKNGTNKLKPAFNIAIYWFILIKSDNQIRKLGLPFYGLQFNDFIMNIQIFHLKRTVNGQ